MSEPVEVAVFAAALKSLWPRGNARAPGLIEAMIAAAPALFAKHEIDNVNVLAHIMAQLSHECGAGTVLVENLNYSPARMMQVWPTRFRTLASAAPFARRPRELANHVYNGRMGNRPGSDDGWIYRGRGAAQTTGRAGYARLAKATGLPLLDAPDLVNDPRYFLACGIADFIACGCLPFAKADDVAGVTRRLNGGQIGLAERKTWLARWKTALTAQPSASPADIARPTLAGRLAATLRALFRKG